MWLMICYYFLFEAWTHVILRDVYTYEILCVYTSYSMFMYVFVKSTLIYPKRSIEDYLPTFRINPSQM